MPEWVNSPSQKEVTALTGDADVSKDLRVSGGFIPESLTKEMGKARNKSQKYRSYYKGGSATQQDRRQTGLKEAAIQIMENRTTKTTLQQRGINISPMTGSKRQTGLLHYTPAHHEGLKKAEGMLAKIGSQMIGSNDELSRKSDRIESHNKRPS